MYLTGALVVVVAVTVAAAAPGIGAVDDGTHATDRAVQTAQHAQTQTCPFPANTSSESFDVSNLSAPSTVQPGDEVMVSADVTNPNDVPLIQCVEFRFEGDVVERRGWALNPNETETITFTVSAEGLDEGTYIHGIEARDTGEVTTLTVSETPPPTASVVFDNQTTDGTSVTVANATLSDGGFVAIHNESGAIVGASAHLAPGTHTNVSVMLDTPVVENTTLTAMPHLDTNGNETFDFVQTNGSEDGPYTDDGAPVTDEGLVTVVSEPTTPNETTTTPNGTATTPNETTTSPNETATTPNETTTVQSVLVV
ncbi:hypothetical protein KU306_01155 [Haloferax larsenii]|uniref:DUF7282 domain-containing protein n=2 Tax=Haloferax larsenii TaxID=302484 RepID=A0ABY5RHG3_HALLR|nr:hypothetical protein KU306_01155 [Haloferax larsenii]